MRNNFIEILVNILTSKRVEIYFLIIFTIIFNQSLKSWDSRLTFWFFYLFSFCTLQIQQLLPVRLIFQCLQPGLYLWWFILISLNSYTLQLLLLLVEYDLSHLLKWIWFTILNYIYSIFCLLTRFELIAIFDENVRNILNSWIEIVFLVLLAFFKPPGMN